MTYIYVLVGAPLIAVGLFVPEFKWAGVVGRPKTLPSGGWFIARFAFVVVGAALLTEGLSWAYIESLMGAAFVVAGLVVREFKWGSVVGRPDTPPMPRWLGRLGFIGGGCVFLIEGLPPLLRRPLPNYVHSALSTAIWCAVVAAMLGQMAWSVLTAKLPTGKKTKLLVGVPLAAIVLACSYELVVKVLSLIGRPF